jgi:hypothetical protein
VLFFSYHFAVVFVVKTDSTIREFTMKALVLLSLCVSTLCVLPLPWTSILFVTDIVYCDFFTTGWSVTCHKKKRSP